MRNRTELILVELMFCVSIVFSQDKTNSSLPEYSIYQYKQERADRLVFDFNHTGWLGVPAALKAKPTSGGVNFYLMFDNPIGRSRFSFGWGLGLSSHNIHGKVKMIYHTDSISNKVVYNELVERIEPYTKNRIGLKVIEMPFELRIRSRTNYQFKAMVGFRVGYVVQSFRKIFDEDGKYKIYDVFGINKLRYGLSLRLGIEQIHVCVFYSLSEYFENKKGPAGINAYSIGVSYTPRISIGGGR